MKPSVARLAIVFALSAVIHLTPTNCFADNISTSITQDGGTFTNATGTLIVGSNSESSPAVLTLKNGATTSGITNLALGTSSNPFPNPGEESGPLENYFGAIEVLGGSTLNTGDQNKFSLAFIGFDLDYPVPDVIPTGTVTVSGTGSTWNHNGGIYLGWGGKGFVNVTDGGKLATNGGSIGFFHYPVIAPPTTTISITGAGSQWVNTGDLTLNLFQDFDQNKETDVAVRDSGSLEVTGDLKTSAGNIVTVDGGTITADKIWNGGTLNILEGTVSTKNFTNTNYPYTQGQLNLFGGTLIVKEGTFHIQEPQNDISWLNINGNNSTSVATLKLTDGADNFGENDGNNPLYYLITEVGESAHGQLVLDNKSEFRAADLYLGTEQGGEGIVKLSKESVLTSWFYIDVAKASGSSGEITVDSGSTATATATRIAMAVNSSGTVTIRGEGTTWTDFEMTVGDQGKGSLNILEGAVVSSGDPTPTTPNYQPAVIIANAAGSRGDVTVDGENTKWNTGGLVIGGEGVGTLRVQNGAHVTSEFAALGVPSSYTSDPTSGVGDAVVTGENSAWDITRTLNVGGFTTSSQAQGKLKILDGAAVICDSAIVTSPNPNTVTSVIVNGESSTLQAHHGMWVGSLRANVSDAGIYPGNGQATLVVENGSHLISQGTFVELPAIDFGLLLTQGGTISGNGGFIVGDVANWGGIISPGSSPGIMTIDGNYSQLSRTEPYYFFTFPGQSELHIELAGLNQGTTYDFLHVTGTTTLGGLLTLDFLDGFENLITPTNTFTILTSDGGLTGDFTNLDLHHRLNARWGSFLVSYEHNSVVLSDFVAVPEVGSIALAGITALACVAYWFIQQRQLRTLIETEVAAE